MNPPPCGKCGNALPWEDVDRGSGTCRGCGHPFDFSAPAPPPMSVGGDPPTGALAPPAPTTHQLPLPSLRIPRPATVKIAESATGYVIAWNAVGMREHLVIAVAVASLAIAAWSVVSKDTIGAGIFLVLGIVAGFAALRARNAGGGISVQGPSIISDEGPELPIADVTSFHVEVDTAKGASIVACVRDQRYVPLATNIEDRPVAIFVAQLLIERILKR